MGCGASTPQQSGFIDASAGKLQPTFTEKQAMKQIKRIDRFAPRKKLEERKVFQIKVGNKLVDVPFAYVSQTGYYPDELDKANQDALYVRENLGDKDHKHAFFGVFDGHGKVGDLCSNFVAMELWEAIEREPTFESGDYYNALVNAHHKTNMDMHEQEKVQSFSDMMSGTTAISAFFNEDTLFISNVGDSRAIAVVQTDNDAKNLISIPLSIDQTPFRKDERERVKKCGARVLTMAQLEGFQDPGIEDYGDEDDNDGDPPRLWTKMGNYPGTAFTRSLGDRVAEEIGVCATPEVLERKITSADKYILLASDGVFEFITSQSVVDIFARFKNDLLNACRAIVAEAYRQWLQFETRTDDITCMIIDVQGIGRETLAEEDLRKRKGSFAIEMLAQEIRAQHDDKLGGGGGKNRKHSQPPQFRSPIESFKLDQAIDKDSFLKMELRPVRRKVANNVGVVQFNPAELDGYELPVYTKSEQDMEALSLAVRNNYLFAHLNDDQIEKAVLAMERVQVNEGDVVIKQFDKGDKFYVAASGRYGVEIAVNKMTTDPSGRQVPIDGQYEEPRTVMEYNCEEGGLYPSFGELALMYNKPRGATIRAITDGVLWGLERQAFHMVLMRDSAHRLIKVLRKVKAFTKLSYNEVARLVELLTEERYKAGDFIVRQGEEGDSFYVIKKGQASVTINPSKEEDGEEPKEVMKLAEYDYFGERALLSGDKRAANVIATEDVTCLMIRKSLFDEVLGRLHDVLAEDGKVREEAAETLSKITCLDQLKVFPQSIPYYSGSLFRCIIRDKNDIVESKEEDEEGDDMLDPSGYCTLRRIQLPEDETERNEVKAMIQKELDVLKKLHCPSLVAKFDHPQSELVCYQLFKQQFVTDLSSLIADRPFDPSSNMLKYSLKVIASAIIELQQNRGILSRGVAPEGILMDINGTLKIADFKYSKVTNGSRTFTLCGVPEYMAPEVIRGQGHGFKADWWSLGVLFTELINGSTIFSLRHEGMVYAAITDPANVEEQLSKLKNVLEPCAFSFLQGLLSFSEEERFIARHEDDLENIPFFAKVRTRESPFAGYAKGLGKKMEESKSS